MPKTVTTVILAGGAGNRMETEYQKVLHPICGRPMLDWVLDAAGAPGANEDAPPIAVLGHMHEQVKERYGERLRYVEQTNMRGSGSALLDARRLLRDKEGRVLVLAGDMPLLQRATVRALLSVNSAAAFLTARMENPIGYARVLRYEGNVTGVIEEEALTNEQQPLREVRVSAYCFEAALLAPVLDELAKESGQGETSMAEIITAFIKRGVTVETCAVSPEEAMGVNDRVQLAACTAVLRRRINTRHMYKGVTLLDPACTYIDDTVKIGHDCTIYPGVVLEGNTVIGPGCTLYPACRLTDSHFGKFVTAQGVVARDAVVGDYVTLGPYVNLRPGTRLGNNCKVGNYIEVKNSVVGEGSKLPHLSYIGDGDVGKNVNLGCGTVFVNYDGHKKHRTRIGDNTFVGCHASLVAPISLGDDVFVAAGSVITENVPDDTLAIARARQVNKIGYTGKLRRKRGDGV
ncbi:MAG: bifunctional UDP-N-acetylglucosamine diphosphorylase/glucosamine-1-phosphate N-acetyltransferase GlmU [Clostridiales bacterium]|nr:bifunctional UDP-N-acetylglucosamine diphosphorylase/glucosamine-1-phosphate N-acetyltransferase GlmU [Clostridiales bacterium]